MLQQTVVVQGASYVVQTGNDPLHVVNDAQVKKQTDAVAYSFSKFGAGRWVMSFLPLDPST